MRRGRRGFTLIELTIVIAVIAIVAAIAVPNLLEARKRANEASAISSLRAVHAAQTIYRGRQPVYADSMPSLRGFVDDGLAGPVAGGPFVTEAGRKNGYWFGLTSGGGAYDWGAAAVPVVWFTSGDRAYFIDESGVVRTSLTFVGGAIPTDEELRGWAPVGDLAAVAQAVSN